MLARWGWGILEWPDLGIFSVYKNFSGQSSNGHGIEKWLFSEKLKFLKHGISKQNKIFWAKRYDDRETFSFSSWLCNYNQLSGATSERWVRLIMASMVETVLDQNKHLIYLSKAIKLTKVKIWISLIVNFTYSTFLGESPRCIRFSFSYFHAIFWVDTLKLGLVCSRSSICTLYKPKNMNTGMKICIQVKKLAHYNEIFFGRQKNWTQSGIYEKIPSVLRHNSIHSVVPETGKLGLLGLTFCPDKTELSL